MKKIILFIAIGLFMSGCAGAQIRKSDFGEKTNLLSEKDEIRLGNYVDASITEEYSVLQNESITNAVSAIGNEIAAVSERSELEFTFRVLNEYQVNAFAAPGGYVYVTRGLLDELKTKGQLAAILAHEVSHTSARHQVKALYNAQTAMGFLIFAKILSVAAGAYTGSAEVADLGDAASRMVTIIVYQGYSRSFEAEADKLGAYYMHKAGYRPAAMAETLDILLELKKKKGTKRNLGIFASHPSLKWRAKRIRRIALQIEKGTKYEEIE